MRLATTLFSILLLAACGLSTAKTADKSSDATAPATRTIDIQVTDAGYAPAHLELTAGETVRLAFHSETDSECSGSVQSKDLGIAPTRLPKGKTTVVEIKAPPAGEYSFACSMEMNRGTVVVKGS